ncbi:MAG: hypothetical protein GF344_09515 [Chitinivibrionales bacterium]|nr:hypothetical protein [Chitinivibrionales bacterium]MBD3357081.1 hypothetical protein [Chitinivibrionales bacterium]
MTDDLPDYMQYIRQLVSIAEIHLGLEASLTLKGGIGIDIESDLDTLEHEIKLSSNNTNGINLQAQVRTFCQLALFRVFDLELVKGELAKLGTLALTIPGEVDLFGEKGVKFFEEPVHWNWGEITPDRYFIIESPNPDHLYCLGEPILFKLPFTGGDKLDATATIDFRLSSQIKSLNAALPGTFAKGLETWCETEGENSYVWCKLYFSIGESQSKEEKGKYTHALGLSSSSEKMHAQFVNVIEELVSTGKVGWDPKIEFTSYTPSNLRDVYQLNLVKPVISTYRFCRFETGQYVTIPNQEVIGKKSTIFLEITLDRFMDEALWLAFYEYDPSGSASDEAHYNGMLWNRFKLTSDFSQETDAKRVKGYIRIDTSKFAVKSDLFEKTASLIRKEADYKLCPIISLIDDKKGMLNPNNMPSTKQKPEVYFRRII